MKKIVAFKVVKKCETVDDVVRLLCNHTLVTSDHISKIYKSLAETKRFTIWMFVLTAIIETLRQSDTNLKIDTLQHQIDDLKKKEEPECDA